MDERQAWEQQYIRKETLWRGGASLHFNVSKGEDVLELGCGNGKTSAALGSMGANVVCLDFSLNALLQCQRSSKADVGLVLADVTGLPFVDHSFDVVVCSHVLEHLDAVGRRAAANEAMRVLRHRGRLEFQGFSTADMRCGVGEKMEESSFRRGDGITYHYFTDNEVADLFPEMRILRSEHLSLRKRYHGEEKVRDVIQAEMELP